MDALLFWFLYLFVGALCYLRALPSATEPDDPRGDSERLWGPSKGDRR